MESGRKPNAIIHLSKQFAIEIVLYAEKLESEKKFVIARQLLKSGTSVGANIHEAQHAESKADFIHKMKIAAKESHETEYWLDLCSSIKSYSKPSENMNHLLVQIQKLLSAIISKTKSHN